MKAILPRSLTVLLDQFESSEEAKSFFVTPPPEHAGSAYEFDQSYFHVHNNLLLKKEMSEELTILSYMLAKGLTAYMAFYTQLKRQNATVIFTPEDLLHYGLVLGQALKGASLATAAGWVPNGGAGTYIGFKTTLGVFPFARLIELQEMTNRLRNPQYQSWQDQNNSWGGGRSGVYGVTGYGGWDRSVRPLDLPPSPIEDKSAVLASLLKVMMDARVLKGEKLNELIDTYVGETYNLDELTAETVEGQKLVISRELALPEISWRIFEMGMKILKIEPKAITLDTADGTKFCTENIALA
jgi:hypothetical protein